MLRNYLTIALRNLFRRKLFSLINTFGLAFSLAACLLVYVFLSNELSFDRFHPKANRIYRLLEYAHYDQQSPVVTPSVAPVMGQLFKNTHGEIERYCRVQLAKQPITEPITIRVGEQKFQPKGLMFADTSFATLFNVRWIAGDRREFLRSANDLVLTESLARTLFGRREALNQTVVFDVGDTTYSMRVSGVIADFPANSHLQPAGLIAFPKTIRFGLHENWGVMMTSTYLQLAEGVDSRTLATKLTKTSQTKSKYLDIKLQRLTDIHLDSIDFVYDSELNFRKSERKYIYIFGVVAVLMFVVASINFINLTTAQVSSRAKEVSLKKVIGAGRRQIFAQFLVEAALASGLALVISLLISQLALPWLNQLINRELSIDLLTQPRLWLLLAALFIATTLASGLYPAWLLASLRIVNALKGEVVFRNRKFPLVNVLVVGQFATAIALIVSTLVVTQQLRFMREAKLGFVRSQIITVPLSYEASAKLNTLKTELARLPGVIDVTVSASRLGGMAMLNGVKYVDESGKENTGSFGIQSVASNYLPFYRMQLVEGRPFRQMTGDIPKEYIVNEAFVKKVGWKKPVGKRIALSWVDWGICVGVVKDFHFNSLHQSIEPLVIGASDVGYMQNELSLKISPKNMPATLRHLESKWGTVVSDYSFQYTFLDEHLQSLYQADQQAGSIISVMGGLAILIACFGLLGLSMIAIRKRTKEIGIRKVLGASVSNIVSLLSIEFLKLVLVANVIAWPLAYYAMNRWLQDFAYRISLGWWFFITAGAVALIIALLTVSFQAIKAAVANPVKSLRTE